MNPSDLKLPWYLKSWIFILVALLSFVHPAIALLIIPLILLRESKGKNYLAQAEELNRQELLRIYDTEKSIIRNAQTQAEELMRNAQSQADSLTRNSQQQLNYLTQQINYTNAEIEKKAFYIAEVERIKAEIDKVEAVLNAGETNTAIIQTHLDTMTRAINDLEDEFDANDSEIETVARDSIAEAVDYLLQKYRINIDLEEALREREW